MARHERQSPDGSPYVSRRGLLAIPLVAAAAALTEGCDPLSNKKLDNLPGEIIEEGTILETPEAFMKVFLQRKAAITINLDTNKFDDDSATIIKSSAYLTMIHLGLSKDAARKRAETIRLVDGAEINANGITKPSSGPENIGIALSRDFFKPDPIPNPNKTAIDGLALVSHEAAHASSSQYVEDSVKLDFGTLGSLDHNGPRFGFTGNGDQAYPNPLLQALFVLPMGSSRLEEFAAEAGRIDFMKSLMDLPDPIKLTLPDPSFLYAHYAEGYDKQFNYAQALLRSSDANRPLSAPTLTPEKVIEFHRNNDLAGFLLSLGQDIISNNKQTTPGTLGDSDIRALGLVAFTGFILTSTSDEGKREIIKDMLGKLAKEPLTPKYIEDQANLLVTTLT